MPKSAMTRKLAVAAVATGFLAGCAGTALGPQSRSTTFPVSFPSGSVELHATDHETIQGVANAMKRDPALRATVLGKADAVGTPEYNQHLSWKRAAAVFEALVFTHQVPEDRVRMRWTGEQLPTVPTADQTAELQNRVVEIIVE